jgi:hypothetical protein
MPKGGSEDSDGLGDAHPAMWESKLSKADERRIRKESFIPPFVKIRFAERGAGALVRSDRHEVCVYETMFRAGFRLPFLPMVLDLLNYLDLSPHQLAPNAWRYLYGCMVLWPFALGKEHQLTTREFLHLHRVHRNPGGSGVYNIQTRQGRLITLEPRYSSNHGCKTIKSVCKVHLIPTCRDYESIKSFLNSSLLILQLVLSYTIRMDSSLSSHQDNR